MAQGDPKKPRKAKAAPPPPKAPRYRKPPEIPKPNALRVHRFPSLLWQRQWLASLKQLFPRGVTQEVVDALWPAAVEQWRYNLSAPAAALNVCQGRGGLFAAEIRERHYAAPLEVERGPRGSALGPPSGLPSGGPTVPCQGPECSLGLMGGACGLPAQLLTPSTQGAPTRHLSRYCLIEADQVITSHDPLHGFRPRPEYPPGVQERRYDKDRNEQYKVIEIAQTLRRRGGRAAVATNSMPFLGVAPAWRGSLRQRPRCCNGCTSGFGTCPECPPPSCCDMAWCVLAACMGGQ